jgi:hypothetical protein
MDAASIVAAIAATALDALVIVSSLDSGRVANLEA